MITNPKVSVVIPTYNAGIFIGEAIESVLGQTYRDFELVIVDNNSTDNSETIIAAYLSDSRVRYIKNETNISLTKNWNKCLELSRGEYIKFLCADDKFHPHLLEQFVPVLDMHPDVSLVGCFKEEFGAQTQLWEIPFHHKQPGRQVILETVKNYNYLGEPTCVMFRREDVEKVGGFRNYSWITDWEMWVRLLTVGNGYIIPERLCFTRNHPGQLTKAIYRMHVHYLEEYHFFKSIKAGDYKIDINHSEAIINKAIKRKAAGYAQIIPKAISKIYKKNYRESLYRAFAITLKEGVWFQTCSLWYNKIHWKVFKAKSEQQNALNDNQANHQNFLFHKKFK